MEELGEAVEEDEMGVVVVLVEADEEGVGVVEADDVGVVMMVVVAVEVPGAEDTEVVEAGMVHCGSL